MSDSLKVVCVLDSFKGSLSSLEAGEAAERGVLKAVPDAQVVVLPIADGGEGTLEALAWAHAVDLHILDMAAADHQTPVSPQYGTFEIFGERVAVLESAEALGINQVQVSEDLQPSASSYGLGLMLLDALDRNVDEVLVTLGGSATTDGGTGVFQALGAVLYDAEGRILPTATNPLWHFDHADFSGLRSLAGAQLTVLSDVTNRLCGSGGAAAIFGPQKGATAEQVEHLDAQLWKWGRALEEHFARPILTQPGSGAAGGLGGAFLAVGGVMQSGFERVAEELQISTTIGQSDLVITGEGSLDWQSAFGKVPAGVGRLAADAGAVVVALAGRVVWPLGDLMNVVDAVFPIHSEPVSLSDALEPLRTALGIERTAEQVLRLFIASAR